MFQFDWAEPDLRTREEGGPEPEPSRLPGGAIEGAMLLQWQEHCIECALPLCYTNCPLYVARRDQKCARLVYGMERNAGFEGLMPFGADLRFRRWGKIEAQLTGRRVTRGQLRLLDRVDRVVTALARSAASLLSWIDPKRRIQGALAQWRGELLQRLGRRDAGYDGFVVECYSFEAQEARLIVELRQKGITVYREGVEIQPGRNFYSLPIKLPAEFEAKDGYLLMVYPDQDREIRLVFTWLDFVACDVALLAPAAPVAEPVRAVAPAAKVKCVAWDLDNTLWRGILVEDGASGLVLRQEAVELIHRLDERGILQTIASKNHHDEAMAVLNRYGLDEFFLYPAIHWGAKSASLKQIAERLNIHIDTFAFIDDSAFERHEVGETLPMVRVFAEDALGDLLSRPEFDVPLTATSRMRRASYRTESLREQAMEEFGAGSLEFLRSCRLKLRVFAPATKEEIARCLELIQRSNQLNLSSRRYDAGQFQALLGNPKILSVAMECNDRFGDYGIVGFASVDVGGAAPVARDFVLSCRVAQKHVEHAFWGWLGSYLRPLGATELRIQLIKTERNRPLVQVFDEMPFKTLGAEGNEVTLTMDLEGEMGRDTVVEVDGRAFDLERVP